jgi:hypothetical protein
VLSREWCEEQLRECDALMRQLADVATGMAARLPTSMMTSLRSSWRVVRDEVVPIVATGVSSPAAAAAAGHPDHDAATALNKIAVSPFKVGDHGLWGGESAINPLDSFDSLDCRRLSQCELVLCMLALTWFAVRMIAEYPLPALSAVKCPVRLVHALEPCFKVLLASGGQPIDCLRAYMKQAGITSLEQPVRVAPHSADDARCVDGMLHAVHTLLQSPHLVLAPAQVKEIVEVEVGWMWDFGERFQITLVSGGVC